MDPFAQLHGHGHQRIFVCLDFEESLSQGGNPLPSRIEQRPVPIQVYDRHLVITSDSYCRLCYALRPNFVSAFPFYFASVVRELKLHIMRKCIVRGVC